MALRRLIGLGFAGALVFSAAAADVIVRVAPPHVVVEKHGPRPSRDHVWISGYHRWDGNTYVWTSGRWEQPPRPHAQWVANRWVHQKGGYVMVEGHWR